MPSEQRSLYDHVVAVLSNKAKKMSNALENLELTELEELAELEARAVLGGKKAGQASGAGEEEGPAAPPTKEESSANMLMTLRRIANHPLLHRWMASYHLWSIKKCKFII